MKRKPARDRATARIDAMSLVEADMLAKEVFGPHARAHVTRDGVRIYRQTGALTLRLLAKGGRWSEVFAEAVEKERPAALR